MTNNNSIKDKVFLFLVRYPETRDCDLLLMSKIWQSEHDIVFNFFHQLEKGCLSNPKTIMRHRRKIQEKIPELRGKKYQERQEKAKKFKTFYSGLANLFKK